MLYIHEMYNNFYNHFSLVIYFFLFGTKKFGRKISVLEYNERDNEDIANIHEDHPS